MTKRIYQDCPNTHVFSVRVHKNHKGQIKEVAARLGVSEVEAKRTIFETGLKALQAA